MSALSDAYDYIGQTAYPLLYSHIGTALMDIEGESSGKDGGGADKKSSVTVLYSDVPVTWKKNKSGVRVAVGDKPISYGHYLMEFPMYHEGARINLLSGHKLRVKQRGEEPEKVFSIVSIFDNEGLEYQVEARKES